MSFIKHRGWLFAWNLLTLFATVASGYGQVPPGFTLTQLASGLSRPATLQALPDGRFLIGEQQTGQIKVYKSGSLLSTPYAIISPLYTGNNESGLLGLCLDPDFSSNGYVYAFVTHDSNTSRVWRFTTSGDVGISPTLIVDNIPHRGVNHNGGGIGFGPDGKLYMAVGEAGDTSWAQDVNILGGKILRANPDGSIPADNPFGNLVWSLGHRHPFRVTFQPGTSRLYVTENGPSQDDELNRIIQGGNYGWPSDTGPNANPSHIDPVHNFSSIVVPTDLLFYQGSAMPFDGELFLVEYLNARIRRFTLSLDGDSVLSGPTDFVTGVSQPVDIEQGIDGALYFTTLQGRLYQVQSDGAATPTTLVANFTNGNSAALNSRVYLWNPSTSAGQVTVRVFTLPLINGIAQELTGTPLDLGPLEARSALNLKLAEDILIPLGITTPYSTDGGNLTLEFTIQATYARGAAQVFSSGLAFGTYPLQEIPSTPSASPTVLVANFLNGNDAALLSRVYLWNPSSSAGNVNVRVFTLPVKDGVPQEVTSSPLTVGVLGAKSALNLKLVEDILSPLGITPPYTNDGGNLTLEFTVEAADVRGVAQVFSGSVAFGTYPLQVMP
jgi:glucose/arabinose dehydrogenase